MNQNLRWTLTFLPKTRQFCGPFAMPQLHPWGLHSRHRLPALSLQAGSLHLGLVGALATERGCEEREVGNASPLLPLLFSHPVVPCSLRPSVLSFFGDIGLRVPVTVSSPDPGTGLGPLIYLAGGGTPSFAAFSALCTYTCVLISCLTSHPVSDP